MWLSLVYLIVSFQLQPFFLDAALTGRPDDQIVNTFAVTNTNDAGPGSLRQAIMSANSSPGTDLVTFNIGTGPQSIGLFSPLPTISDPIVIDGSTQPGYAGLPIIEITRNPNATGDLGINLAAGNSTLKKLVINDLGSATILLTGPGNNTIVGNYIGTDINGTVSRGGGHVGIQVQDAGGNRIGGYDVSERNVISSAFSGGINFYQSSNNIVVGNYFGTDRFGNSAIPNGTGVNISSGNNNLIGGTTEAARNVISGNTNSGVAVLGGSGNVVQGNYIGLKANGTEALPNSGGVTVWGASNTLVGGNVPGARNIISGNSNAVKIWGPETGNKLQGNYIGTDPTGLNPLPNLGSAITLTNPTDVLIGGEAAGEGNVVAGNGGGCISIWSGGSGNLYQTTIRGNYFGVKADGITALGNGFGTGSGTADCITFSNLAQNALISGNVIANNAGKGIYLNGSDMIRLITIRRNRIYDNGGLGISFGTNGILPNDLCDGDNNYPNGNQNYPTFNSAKILGDTVSAHLTMWDSGTGIFQVDVFASESCDISGYGEGKYLLGSFSYPADGSCRTSRNVSYQLPNRSAKYLTATLTDPNGNTSQFSACMLAKGTSAFDFDGDFKTDISIYRPVNGEWWLSRSSDNRTDAAQFGNSADRIVPADFTGDGKTDIGVWRPSGGYWYILRSEDWTFHGFPFGTNGDVPAPADYDGDGKSDAAVFRPSTGMWYIFNSTGNGTSIFSFGAAGDKPAASDFDGDGRADVAVFRPSDGTWWYLRSSDGQARAFQFGVSTDKPVPGDFTGDGKADLAVWRPTTGEWFVQRSEDNSFYGFPFGTAGDIPVPGDYDGDGKTEPAVFRPSTATWYIQRSTAGLMVMGFGSPSDRPIPSAFVP